MDAHVPQCTRVVRLTQRLRGLRWPGLLLAIAWMFALAAVPWWIGVPLLLALAMAQVVQVPRLQHYGNLLRYALRWGFAGVLSASYRAFGGHAQGLTYTMLAALAGCSLLVLLESWRKHKPLRDVALAAQSPEWCELAMAPVGPAAVIIEIQPAIWLTSEQAVKSVGFDLRNVEAAMRRSDKPSTFLHDPPICLSSTQRWAAWRMPAGRGVVLYDRTGGKALRLRGWQLFGWQGDEAWLTRAEDQPPLALSHVLGQIRSINKNAKTYVP